MNYCYTDNEILCTGAQFSFCPECKIAQKVNADEIANAKTPIEVTAAHTLTKTQVREWLYADMEDIIDM
jgi:hypothetical protein